MLRYSLFNQISVNDNEFLKQIPQDIHLLRLSMMYSIYETKKLAMFLGMQYKTWEQMYDTIREAPERLNFETLRRCCDESHKTFNDIRNAIEKAEIQNPHNLCKVSSISISRS